MKRYKVLMHQAAWQKAQVMLASLKNGRADPGEYLRELLEGHERAQLATDELIELLVATKRPQIFAESAVAGDGSDWTLAELSLLGDIAIGVTVTVFDDGRHYHPVVHSKPFKAALIYVPGALLRNGQGQTPVDWDEVTAEGKIDSVAYAGLYESRLLPALLYANHWALARGRKAFVTLPGLGCGQFAGPFIGQLGEVLKSTVASILERHVGELPHVRAVYFDPYRECSNDRAEIGHLSFFVRPLMQGNEGKSQLCLPVRYEEAGDDFSDCDLCSLVAWDHVSWPDNDFYIGSRVTDDGVKAAATDSMAAMTGIEGVYDISTNSYDPPEGYRNWKEVVQGGGLGIKVRGNLDVFPRVNGS
jgi:hypothetical protein